MNEIRNIIPITAAVARPEESAKRVFDVEIPARDKAVRLVVECMGDPAAVESVRVRVLKTVG